MILSKKTYWILSWTWGIIMTVIGFIATKALNLLGCRTERNIYGYRTYFGKGWGGVDLGPFCIVSKDSTQRTFNHEFGHSIQNCFLGPLFPFIVAIPSAVRYWYHRYKLEVEKVPYEMLPAYDSIWFEGTATDIGNKYYKAQSN